MSTAKACLVAGVVVGMTWVGAGDVLPQTRSTPPAGTIQDRMSGGQEVEGRIRDVGNERVTLEDGTVLAVPKGMAKPSDLKVGAMVKAKYQERNGQKVATSIQVNPASESGTGTGSGSGSGTK
jgi:hypothetical protein